MINLPHFVTVIPAAFNWWRRGGGENFEFLIGKKDEIVPHEHSIKLYDKAKVLKKSVFIDEAIHNNLYDFGIEKDVIGFNLKLWK